MLKNYFDFEKKFKMTIPQTLAWVAPPARPSRGPTPRPVWTGASSIFPQRAWLPRVFLIVVGYGNY